MRKKLETLPLSELKAIAKENNLKNISALRKSELIDRLCELHEERQGAQPKAASNTDVREENSQRNEPDQAQQQQATSRMPEVSAQVNEEGAAVSGEAAVENRPVSGSVQPAEGETRRSREYRPRNTEFAQRAAGNMRRPQGQQMRPGMNRPQRSYDYNQRTDRRPYNRPQAVRSDDGEAVQSEQPMRAAENPEANQQVNQQVEVTTRPDGQRVIAADVRQENVSVAVQAKENGNENIAATGAELSSGDPGTAKSTAEGAVDSEPRDDLQALDSGIPAHGILEVMPDGFGFIRSANYLPGDDDVYVAPSQIRRFNLKTGDIITGMRRVKTAAEKFAAMLYLTKVNGYPPAVLETRPNFEDLTPIFPNFRLHLERPGGTKAMRIVDLLSPIGKGQRGMIVSPPKAGKTTLLKDVAKAINANHPDMHLIILLIDERPEEVTDIKESIEGANVEVIYSTFDELPDHHKRVSEMVLERAKRLVEHGRDVMILLDSITRLARAYNLTVAPSGRTLSGGLDPAALYMPKRFFGAARNMREGGSLTVLATALVDTGSRMDDVVFEEFKGTGNMELVLDRKLSEKRIFPAIDILKSGTRRDDLLLTPEERATADYIHKTTGESRGDEVVERVLNLFAQTRTNREFIAMAAKWRN